MTDEEDKRVRETVRAEIERRKKLLRAAEDSEHPPEEAEERLAPEAADA